MLNSPGLAWWMVRHEADRRQAHQVRLVPTGGRVEFLFDTGRGHDLPEVSDGVLSVLAMRLPKLGARSGWHVDVHPAGFAPAIHLIRRRSESKPTHPSDWNGAYQSFKQKPEGLMILIRPDAYLARHGLARLASAGVEAFDADEEEARELALHTALAGNPTVAVASDDDNWWAPVMGAVPIRVLRATRTSHGLSWDSFTL
ncbi:MAG: hypothetical protein WCK01_02175 [Candidatus Uhrbacteria bacterium]